MATEKHVVPWIDKYELSKLFYDENFAHKFDDCDIV